MKLNLKRLKIVNYFPKVFHLLCKIVKRMTDYEGKVIYGAPYRNNKQQTELFGSLEKAT